MKKEKKIFTLIILIFLGLYFMPVDNKTFLNAIISGLKLLNNYAKQHVLTCLIPAFFIAGAVNVFIKKDNIFKYLGNKANKILSYTIASVSGVILAVCSCTILPLFAGIRQRGAGLGPAVTFLFSGPAINIAAIFLTLSVLGIKTGVARIIFAIIISIAVGISMAFIFKEKQIDGELFFQKDENMKTSKIFITIFFISLIGILAINGIHFNLYIKYFLMITLFLFSVSLSYIRFGKQYTNKWFFETWGFVKLLIPYLLIGVFIAGFIMPYLPDKLIIKYVGNNTIISNLISSCFGAFMYFSTLTEIPVLQSLSVKGMHHGPALSLLLAGPSLSLPNMLVIRKILGNKKTVVYVLLVIIYSTIGGYIFGMIE